MMMKRTDKEWEEIAVDIYRAMGYDVENYIDYVRLLQYNRYRKGTGWVRIPRLWEDYNAIRVVEDWMANSKYGSQHPKNLFIQYLWKLKKNLGSVKEIDLIDCMRATAAERTLAAWRALCSEKRKSND